MITDDILARMLETVPETRPFLEEKYELGPGEALPTSDGELSLYVILLDGLVRPVLQPALAAPEGDEDLLRRCFKFVEEVYAFDTELTRGAVYFQVLESLLDAREYLVHAIPFLRGNIREPVSEMLRTYEVEGYEDGLPPLQAVV
ncbi:hypothetical protein [Streptomyces sp. NPDC059593]|uniref:DUF7674 family protein n=1 Tax=Streptomyces sp. NPDC059593 TaxID=3346878 RepID=UPI0036CA2FAF